MNITINVDDKDLESKIAEGIQALDAEDIAKICKDVIVEAVSDKEFVRGILGVHHERYASESWWELHPKVLEILQKAVKPELASEFADKIEQAVKKDFHNLIVDSLAKAFVSQLFTCDAQSNMYEAIRHYVDGGR